ncbi:FKBP-type peptidyl-prolyl cis-trans isomerase [Candidatus Pandoraea novymonadis]|uniref:peptidylprolyl isomerase n=1 Tax=Candidatus Pandoraea novymonadis TaxID=1808959 RepID=A0ABX5FEX4_9BURK|nr:peptidylprolyl isomerase [Candidatus Pandoraea novymonadis]PSB92256.1 FKBP-type peptidyl-prolyl cis-trans isomerase SlyD [Candidatus Pandoraea novymonadis]
MKIKKNTVVSVTYTLLDTQGNLIEDTSDQMMLYLHGGYDGTLPKIEEALDGQHVGFETKLQLEPSDAFGDYDAQLIKIEERDRFPEPLKVGMQFEGIIEDIDDEDDMLVYTVTNISEDKVVLDGNHPLAGKALRFLLKVTDVRAATEEEIEDAYACGSINLRINDENEEDLTEPTFH